MQLLHKQKKYKKISETGVSGWDPPTKFPFSPRGRFAHKLKREFGRTELINPLNLLQNGNFKQQNCETNNRVNF